ncbi:hypothetical protein [Amycolatopsis orientalis]|uniref:hypothetical protein n=1 Tax=Amycolatopsis orientalis TaxID=31958 RepID=UPI001319E187|nr:hypothetical protein [Amycolatopsis orientalis]
MQVLSEVAGAVGGGSAQAAVQGAPAQAVQVSAEKTRAGQADDHLGGRFDPGRAEDVMPPFAEAAVRSRGERSADSAQCRVLADLAPVEAVPVALGDLDELGQHFLGRLFRGFLRGLSREPRQQAHQPRHQRAFDLHHRGPPGCPDSRDQRGGERVRHRPDQVRGGDRDRNEDSVFRVFHIQRVFAQCGGFLLGPVGETGAHSAEFVGVVGEVGRYLAAHVGDHLFRQLAETGSGGRNLLRDLIPFGGQFARFVLVALRPGVTRDDVEHPVQAGVHHEAHCGAPPRSERVGERVFPE